MTERIGQPGTDVPPQIHEHEESYRESPVDLVDDELQPGLTDRVRDRLADNAEGTADELKATDAFYYDLGNVALSKLTGGTATPVERAEGYLARRAEKKVAKLLRKQAFLDGKKKNMEWALGKEPAGRKSDLRTVREKRRQRKAANKAYRQGEIDAFERENLRKQADYTSVHIPTRYQNRLPERIDKNATKIIRTADSGTRHVIRRTRIKGNRAVANILRGDRHSLGGQVEVPTDTAEIRQPDATVRHELNAPKLMEIIGRRIKKQLADRLSSESITPEDRTEIINRVYNEVIAKYFGVSLEDIEDGTIDTAELRTLLEEARKELNEREKIVKTTTRTVRPEPVAPLASPEPGEGEDTETVTIDAATDEAEKAAEAEKKRLEWVAAREAEEAAKTPEQRSADAGNEALDKLRNIIND